MGASAAGSIARTITTRERDLTGRTDYPRSPPAPTGVAPRIHDAHGSVTGGSVEPVHPTSDSRWTPMRSRRDVLKLGALIAAERRDRSAARRVRRAGRKRSGLRRSSSARSPSAHRHPPTHALSGPITVLAGRRRSEHRTGAEEGLRRLQGPEPRHRVGHPGDPGPRPRMGSAGACRAGVGRAGGARDARWLVRSSVDARRPAGGPRRRPGAGQGARSSAGAIPSRGPGRDHDASLPPP